MVRCLVVSRLAVTPAKAGVQLWALERKRDPGLRRDDGVRVVVAAVITSPG